MSKIYFFSIIAGLGEFRIRDLNDEINKLLREKRHWEDRILELGGPDYNVFYEIIITYLINYYRNMGLKCLIMKAKKCQVIVVTNTLEQLVIFLV